ncbi:C25 family cysteine peptidase [Lignipirellula cremea]|uniref:Lys-gingipain n=1 Tax=Lignipirellula cremea TaxID=2528010 RepID=A0A518DVK6_9BACT|nr:C25 family cysteine peptidase [Lignipirellula cremea]QDU95868.1 Lys-gingipain precursor [Lignipirellula cremea]
MPILLLSLCLLSADPSSMDTAIDTAIVCPADFIPALTPWVRFREEQGHRFILLDNRQPAEQIQRQLRQLAGQHPLKAVLLVGDAAPTALEAIGVVRRITPTLLSKAKVNIHWGSEPEIASDNGYADLDGDQLPDLAVGRLPADSPAELSTMVRKIIAYETSPDLGLWRRKINFVAGVGGFGAVADTVLETATKKFMVEGVPASYETSMTYSSWRSPFCPDPRKFNAAALYRLNEGCLFWVYIGHGSRTHLDGVRTPEGLYPIMSTRDAPRFAAAAGAPIAIMLACYTGAFDYEQDCLAEEMMRSPGGPVAAISGSRVTMPYAMTIMANELMKEYFTKPTATLGEVLLNAKRRAVETSPNDPQRQLIDMLAAVISPKPELLREERYEHLELFNLIGDPLLRLHRPAAIRLLAAETVVAGEKLHVTGVAPVGGRCTVEIACRRDRMTENVANRTEYVTQDLARYDNTYFQANNQTYARHVVDLNAGDFEFDLTTPADARGACHVRVYIEGEKSSAQGSADVFVSRP